MKEETSDPGGASKDEGTGPTGGTNKEKEGTEYPVENTGGTRKGIGAGTEGAEETYEGEIKRVGAKEPEQKTAGEEKQTQRRKGRRDRQQGNQREGGGRSRRIRGHERRNQKRGRGGHGRTQSGKSGGVN